jgi:hypothetical protein
MEWTKSLLTEFIEMYKERPCLSESYKNKNLRNSDIGEIVGFLKSSGFKNAKTKVVKEKIQNIRRPVNKERKKNRREGAERSQMKSTFQLHGNYEIIIN